jgi:3D (Asp-Asp-Asp) domain-containing protein
MVRRETESWGAITIWAAVPAFIISIINYWADTKLSLAGLSADPNPRQRYFSATAPDSIFAISKKQKETKVTQKKGTSVHYRYLRSVVAKVTGYTPGPESCAPFADGITSTGRNAKKTDGLAAAPDGLPYGTLVHIPDVGFRVVDDTGSAMRKAWDNGQQTHLDLRFQELNRAKSWGVQQKVVHIFAPAKH